MMAVLVSALMLSGCIATHRDAREIKTKLNRIEESQLKSDNLVAQMDSLITALFIFVVMYAVILVFLFYRMAKVKPKKRK